MKKFIAFFVLITLTVSMLFGMAISASAETYSGTCGEGVTWTVDTEAEELIISGNGAMSDYSYDYNAPWNTHRTNIKTLTIEEGVTRIGNYAFSNCSNLISVTIPTSLKYIGSSAFSSSANITSVYTTNLEAWFSIVFEDASSNPLNRNSSSNINKFYLNDTQITDLIIPENVTEIKDYAFTGLRSLSSVTIPEGVTRIGKNAFASSLNLKTVKLPSTLKSIDNNAFSMCQNLYTVHINDLAAWCSIDFANYNSVPYASTGGGGGYLYLNEQIIKDIVIPDGTMVIKDYAFYYARITSVIIPEGVATIGAKAFSSSNELKKVIIPESVTTIGENAFSYCGTIEDGIIYCGDETKWENVSKGYEWDYRTQYTFKYHDFVNEEITTEPTHLTEGVKTFTCECGEAKTEVIPKLEAHEWNDGEVTTEATHLEKGIKTFTCECGETKTEDIPKLEAHEWDDGEVTKEPTHLEEGVKTFTCECGETKTEDIPKLEAHKWDDGEVTTEPTYDTEGIKTFTCECGETKTEAVEKLERPATTTAATTASPTGSSDSAKDTTPTKSDSSTTASTISVNEGGCSSSLTLGAGFAIIALGCAATMLCKKKEY